MKGTKRWLSGWMGVGLALASVLSGCAGKAANAPVFWPPAPDLPRVQYLRAIKDSTDVVKENSINLLSLGDESSVKVPIIKPYAIAAAKGKVYLTDTVAGEVVIMDLPGHKISRLAGNVNVGKLSKPVGIAVGDDGNIFVADSSRMEVLEYAPDGSYLRAIGKKEKVKPGDVKVAGNFLYVLDGPKGRLLVFDRTSGELLRSFGQQGPDVSRLMLPMGLAADRKGNLYVTTFDGRVVCFDRDGHFRRGFGKLGQSYGEFGRPRGIAVDGDGILYIVDAAFQNVRLFDDQFRILMDFGTPGTRGSLNVPAGIAVTTDNLEYFQKLAEPGFVVEKLILVVSQFGDHKISIYGLGKKEGVDYVSEYQKIQEEIGKKEKELKAKALEEKGGAQQAKPVGQEKGPGAPVPAAR